MAGKFPLCCVCNEPITLLDNLSNIEGKPAHKKCVKENLISVAEGATVTTSDGADHHENRENVSRVARLARVFILSISSTFFSPQITSTNTLDIPDIPDTFCKKRCFPL